MSSKFKWKIVEYNGTEQAIVDYCKNFMTSVCTYGKNGKNKLFTPPNPFMSSIRRRMKQRKERRVSLKKRQKKKKFLLAKI